VGANELSALLWRERELLELLLFKLEEEQLLLTAGKSRWIQHATREVEQVMERLRTSGLARTVEVAEVARQWGVPEESTLRELAAHAPSGPWGDVLGAHLRAMRELTDQIKQVRDLNEQFLRQAARSTQELFADLHPEAGTYDSRGGSGAPSAALLFDTRM
jgi:flagellar biosynthesis/type III secretory pathway chaperone